LQIFLACHYSCSKCLISGKENCEICDFGKTKRYKDATDQCVCFRKYYDLDGTNACVGIIYRIYIYAKNAIIDV